MARSGGPPNNWPSVLTGESGWCFDDVRGQYYFSNFLQSQPDLNWHNEAVRAEILDIARYWLDLGIDGMRLDAVNFFCHDALLRDNPLRGEDDGHADGIDPDNPAAAQVFCNSFCREETFEMLRPLRRLADEYPGVVLLGEVTLCEDSIEEAARYTRGQDRLHLAYNSGLLFKEPMTATRLRALIEKASAAYGEGGTCWIVGNHDYGRMRWSCSCSGAMSSGMRASSSPSSSPCHRHRAPGSDNSTALIILKNASASSCSAPAHSERMRP